MKFLKENIVFILLLIVIVFVTLAIKSFLTKAPVNEEMIINREKIKYLESNRIKDSVVLVETRGRYDSVTSLFMKKDTVIVTKLIVNDKKIKDIINSVRDASKDELRSYRPED